MNVDVHAGPDNDSDVGDEDAAALEREFEAARAHDAGAVSALAERAAKEKAKGMAIASQKALWERTLELRILLQRCVQVPGFMNLRSDESCHYHALKMRSTCLVPEPSIGTFGPCYNLLEAPCA